MEEKCSLCFDCYNATGGCTWSKFLIPVKGWVAEKIDNEYGECYRVDSCPKFVRDSFDGGETRATEKQILDRHDIDNDEAGLDVYEEFKDDGEQEMDGVVEQKEVLIKPWAC